MTPDRRRQIESLVEGALARGADDRATYLEAACGGDVDLRREIESLLAGQEDASGLLRPLGWASGADPLMPGTRLGPYEIEGPIGAGGMGEVYRARDSRLGRTVAIKVLPPELASDAERRRRFEHEARAASALNHPHICTLYDIGSTSSPQAAGRPSIDYLVMECLEGQTLAARLAKGLLPLAQALDVGAQIADALGAAHKAVIIHRDLKPANVMLTKAPAGANGPSGCHATLLDFGLAKLHAPRGAGDASAALSEQTTPGMLLGTLPYMAPEQVAGKDADARTDIWALGLLLYEMLTGTRAFAGDSAAALSAAILEHEPEPLARLKPDTPPILARLITKCLSKDPDARWQDAHDVADELRWIAQHGVPPGTANTEKLARRAARILALAAGAVILFGGGAGLMWALRPAPPRPAVVRSTLSVAPADEVNSGGDGRYFHAPGGATTAFAWTPDGQELIFAGRRGDVQQLYRLRLDAEQADPIPGTEGAQLPAVSSDGRWLAFWSDRALRKTLLDGGAVSAVARLDVRPFGLVWDTRGHLLFGTNSGIQEVRADGSIAQVTSVATGEVAHVLPHLLGQSGTILFTARRSSLYWGDEELVAYTPTSGERKVLLRDAVDGRYLPSGHLLFMRRGALWAVLFDASRLQVTSEQSAVLEDVVHALVAGRPEDRSGAGQYAVSATGTLAWLPGTVMSPPLSRLVTIDRHGVVSPLPGPVRPYPATVRVSPDERWLAVAVRTLTNQDLEVYDLKRFVSRPLATGGRVGLARWLPGSAERLVFPWWRDGRSETVVLPLDGSAGPVAFDPAMLERGTRLTRGRGNESLGEIVIVSAVSGEAVETVISDKQWSLMHPELSPDGRWLAFTRRPVGGGRREDARVLLRPYPGAGGDQMVFGGRANSPAWNPNGRELFFVAYDPYRMMTVDFENGRLGQPRELFRFDFERLPLAAAGFHPFDVSPDGQRFYAVEMLPETAPEKTTRISIITNWFEELKAKVGEGGR